MSEKTYRGKITELRLNVKKTNDDGEAYKLHILVIEEDDSGKERKFTIPVKSKPASFVEKLEEGQQVAVKTEKYKDREKVVAVFNNNNKKSSGKQSSSTQSSGYDATGAIQGMILKAAIDLSVAEGLLGADDRVEQIKNNAKAVLEAKKKVDELVVKALAKKSKQEDDEDHDNEQDDESDDSDEDVM